MATNSVTPGIKCELFILNDSSDANDGNTQAPDDKKRNASSVFGPGNPFAGGVVSRSSSSQNVGSILSQSVLPNGIEVDSRPYSRIINNSSSNSNPPHMHVADTQMGGAVGSASNQIQSIAFNISPVNLSVPDAPAVNDSATPDQALMAHIALEIEDAYKLNPNAAGEWPGKCNEKAMEIAILLAEKGINTVHDYKSMLRFFRIYDTLLGASAGAIKSSATATLEFESKPQLTKELDSNYYAAGALTGLLAAVTENIVGSFTDKAKSHLYLNPKDEKLPQFMWGYRKEKIRTTHEEGIDYAAGNTLGKSLRSAAEMIALGIAEKSSPAFPILHFMMSAFAGGVKEHYQEYTKLKKEISGEKYLLMRNDLGAMIDFYKKPILKSIMDTVSIGLADLAPATKALLYPLSNSPLSYRENLANMVMASCAGSIFYGTQKDNAMAAKGITPVYFISAGYIMGMLGQSRKLEERDKKYVDTFPNAINASTPVNNVSVSTSAVAVNV